MRHISNPNTTSRTPNTNTADKRHQINPPFHQKACYAPAMKSKEATPKYQKEQHPTTENTKATSNNPRDGTTSTKKGRANTARPLSSRHKGTLNKDSPSTPQPSRRNTSQTPMFHMEQTTGIITTRTIPSPQTPQGYTPPRGGAPAGSPHLNPRRQI